MWEMYEGLKIARRQGFLQLIVESDSKLLVDVVTTTASLLELPLSWFIVSVISLTFLSRFMSITLYVKASEM